MASIAERIGTVSTEEPTTSPIDQSASVPAQEQKIDWSEDYGQMDGATVKEGGDFMQEPEYDVQVKLIDESLSEYSSAATFQELGISDSIMQGLHAMHFRAPSKIQARALPLLMRNPPQNLIGQSQSGTGKTAAFVLNILTRLDFSSPEMRSTPQALVLAPTRELARQIIGVIQVMGMFVEGLEVSASIPVERELRARKLEGQIIVGTPGTTMDLVKRRQIDTAHVKVLVLDEADNMLDQQGLGEQCIRVKMALPRNVQLVLFSATFPEKVIMYAEKFAPAANQITLRHEELTVDGIKQLYMDCPSEQAKYSILVKLYELMTVGSSIIFVKRRDTALEISKRMTAEGHKVVSLTGAYEGATRDTVIDSFRGGQAKVLIATNVLARGIDVQSVSMVINYDVPDDGHGRPDPQTYLHRIGRTGRFGRVGVSISFVYDQASWEMLKYIQDYYQIGMIRIDTTDWDLVEETVRKVIKSSRAAPNYQPALAAKAHS